MIFLAVTVSITFSLLLFIWHFEGRLPEAARVDRDQDRTDAEEIVCKLFGRSSEWRQVV